MIGVLAFVKSLFGGGKLLDGAKNLIDKVVTSKAEKEELTLKMEDMLKTHEQEILTAEIADRDSARSREAQVVKAGSKNITQNILAYVGVTGFFGIIGYLFSKGLGNMSAEESFIIGN